MKNFFAHETSVIDKNVKVGKGTKIWHWTHVSGNAKIGRNCSIGQNVFIGNNVRIGNNVKIQNNVSVYEGVTLEDDVFCGPSVVFTNVKFPRSNRKINPKNYSKTLVKKGSTIGANATILSNLKIGKYSFVAAGSVVTKDIKSFSVVLGNPAYEYGKISQYNNKILKLKSKKK